MKDLHPLLQPGSIAVIGASADPVRIGGRPIAFLKAKGYPGRVFPVNPRYDEIAGWKCYPSILEVPEPVDLAVVSIPASALLEGVSQCAQSGVKAVVVFSSGLGEMGEEGRRLEEEITTVAEQAGMLLCGPNTLGFMNTFDNVMATFSQAGEGEAIPGPIAFITQSGAFGTALFALARSRGLNFGYFINTGNEAGLTFTDFLDYVLEDPRIQVVAGYIEGLKDGQSFVKVARRALTLGKPVVIVKVGRSASGAQAAMSHTGSLAGTDAVYDGVFRQMGVMRAQNEEQLLDFIAALLMNPPSSGPRIGMVTQSGGAGVLMADRCDELGLSLARFEEATQEALREVIPAFGSIGNPVDITGQFIAEPELLQGALKLVLEDPNVDTGIFYLGLMERAADQVISNLREAHTYSSTPLLVAWAGAPEGAINTLTGAGICVLPGATRVVDAAHALVRYGEWTRTTKTEGDTPGTPPAFLAPTVSSFQADGRRLLSTEESLRLLTEAGLPVARGRLARTAEEAASFAEEVGGPIVLKVDSPDLPHKTESGLMRFGIVGAGAARKAFKEIMDGAAQRVSPQAMRGVLMQEAIPPGLEAILGLHQDPHFGLIIMAGLGGIWVEVLKDVAFRAIPIERRDAEAMLAELRGQALFEGVRGRPRYDRTALVDAMVRLSAFGEAFSDVIDQLDVNPVIVLPEDQGAVVVDALVVLRG